MSQDCTIPGTVNGVDNGNIIIQAGKTLTINSNQTIAWETGKSISIGAGSHIVLQSGAKMQQNYLWLKDTDGDGYPDNGTQVVGPSAGSGYRRKHLMSSDGSGDYYNPVDAWPIDPGKM